MEKDKEGKLFEKQVLKTLQDMGIKSYGSHSQISLQALHDGEENGEHLEIDIVCLVESICILVETTTQKSNNSDKIKKFIRHCNLVVNSPLNKSRFVFTL